MSNLTFEPEGHIYRLDGVTIPSVTQVLEATGISSVSGIPKDVLERASFFGVAVHKTIELYNNGSLDIERLDVNLVPYLNSWKNFVIDFDYIHKKSEFISHHPKYRYGFMVDLIGAINKGNYKGPVLGDLKTCDPRPAHKYQLAGYKLGVGSFYNTFILYLNPELKPRGYKIVFARNNMREQSVFLSALTVFNIRKEEGLI